MQYYALTIFFLIFGCGHITKHDAKDTKPDERMTQLETKYQEVYQSVEGLLELDTGWPSNTDCDGTLWAGLSCSLGFPTKIELAEYSPGEIHRRPFKACWNETEGDVGSKSTISKDMILGYSTCLWKRKDLKAFQRLADYGEKNEFVMGKPIQLVSRVLLSGNGIGLLGRSIYVLSSGTDDRYYRRVGFLFPKVEQDFERHLQVQGILLQDQVDSSYDLISINGEMLDRLLENVALEPNDFLFAAALGRFTGDQSKTLTLLLDDQTACPTYARGDKPETYCKLLWLQAAGIVLGK